MEDASYFNREKLNSDLYDVLAPLDAMGCDNTIVAVTLQSLMLPSIGFHGLLIMGFKRSIV
jgi:hypothetical protein